MQNIKKKPFKRYIDIYRKSDKKLVVTLLYSKEALRQAEHICSCFDFYYSSIFEVMTGWYNRLDWTTVKLGPSGYAIDTQDIYYRLNVDFKESIFYKILDKIKVKIIKTEASGSNKNDEFGPYTHR